MIQPKRILIVDDEENMRTLLRIHLKRHDYLVIEATNGPDAMAMLKQESCQLIILDIMMPGLSGWEVLEQIRLQYNLPVLMLTAQTGMEGLVRGLNSGADDYLIKPFKPEELIARVGALLRRTAMNAELEQTSQLHYPQLIIDMDCREIRICDTRTEFTPKEYELMQLLASHPQRAYTRDMIVEQLWSLDYAGDNRSVDNHVKNVREKAARAGLPYNPIQTIWGVGYKWNAERGSQ